MKKTVFFLLLFCLLSVFSMQASDLTKTVVTYMDPDNPHEVTLYNNREGKTILVVDCVEYPDESGSYTDTLLLDDEGRIVRAASLGIYNGQEVRSEPSIFEQPTTSWDLDEAATMPYFRWTDYETIDAEEQNLVSHYERLRKHIISSASEKAVYGMMNGSWLFWVGLGLIMLGITAGIATLTMKLSSKNIRIIGGYVVAIFLWAGLYPVWSYLNVHFKSIYTVTFVILFSILVTIYGNVIMNRVEADRTLSNREASSSFYIAFALSVIVCIMIGYHYGWCGAILGFLFAFSSNMLLIARPNRCEECRSKGTYVDYDDKIIGTKIYETSQTEGSPEVYRVYREETREVYVKRFRCTECGHIHEDAMKHERTIHSTVIRREYLFTEKQRPAPQAKASSSGSSPKVYEITKNGHTYILTQDSKYSAVDFTDQYGGSWEKRANGFQSTRSGVGDPNG